MMRATRSEHGPPLQALAVLGYEAARAFGSGAAEAFATLKQTIGTHPETILAAQHSALAALGKAGTLPDVSAKKLLPRCEHRI